MRTVAPELRRSQGGA